MPVKFVLNAPPPSFSYDKSHGWSVGVGAAAEIGDVGFNSSFSFNQDGSKSLNTGEVRVFV